MLRLGRSFFLLFLLISIAFPMKIYALQRRIALVIGNSAYKSSPLNNPVNDAHDVTLVLQRLGFQVILKNDADLREMHDALDQFKSRLGKNDVALFYYAGHGLQKDGINYLLPVNNNITAASDIRYEALAMGKVLGRMEEAGSLNIIILDACRNNPLGHGFSRSFNRGLAVIAQKPKGTIIVYATAPGEIASDGTGRNGLFTQALLKHIETPDIDISKMFRNVGNYVSKKSNGKQIPWLEFSLYDDFYLASSGGVIETSLPKASTKGRLYVDTVPANAKVRILNIGPKFQQGMELESGNYHVAVSAKGYGNQTRWVTLSGGESKRAVFNLPGSSAEQSAELREAPQQDRDRPPSNSGKRITNSLGMTFVYIQPGNFLMGSPENEPQRGNGELQHQVTLTKGFYMQTTEVTQEQWQSIMGNNPSSFKQCGKHCPVDRVSWNDAQVFIKRLNAKENTAQYRLPTEAEWEYAARAGTQTPFAFGRCLSNDQANYNGDFPLIGCSKGRNRQTTVAVGSFQPNAWGLYDIHGNVEEWCADWYGEYSQGAVVNPTGPKKGSRRVLRGGCWSSSGRGAQSAFRGRKGPAERNRYCGFRIARGQTANK